jgi:DNA-binding CsgD family transcriptional regulator
MHPQKEYVRDDVRARPFPEPSRVPEGIVVVDLSFRPVAMDSGGEAILTQFDDLQLGRNSVWRLPQEIERRLREDAPAYVATSADWNSASSGQYHWRAFLMKPQNAAISQPLLAIHIRQERSLIDAARQVCRGHHLTAREEETLVLIAMGLSTKQVADRMNISPNTVNAFLRLIMVKMGVTTRAGILGRLLDGSGACSEAAG